MHRWSLAGVAVLLALAIQARGALYTFTDLGTLGQPNNASYGTWPHEINNTGDITGRGSTPQTTGMGFYWHNGTMTPLGSLGGGTSEGFGINDQGQIAGDSRFSNPNQPGVAMTWINGTMTPLAQNPNFAGGSSAKAISNSGPNGVSIAGYVNTASNNTGGALWQNNVLTIIAGMSIGMGINDSGTVVGYAGSGLSQQAVRYQNGSTTTIYPGAALDVNNAGQIVGYHFFPGDPAARPCIYDHGVVTDIGIGGSVNQAMSINDYGVVVGRYQPSSNVDRAFLWQSGTFYDLNTLASAGTGATFITAEGINNLGQITGLWRDSHNVIGGYLLTPTSVPEPGAIAILSLAGAALLRRPRRRRN